MNLSAKVQAAFTDASARALATNGPHGINVVPISMARMTDEAIWVFDFFMGKTMENMIVDPEVAISCWSGLRGVQIKGEVTIHANGPIFEEGAAWVKENGGADRVTRHVIVIRPKHVFDVSAGVDAGRELVG